MHADGLYLDSLGVCVCLKEQCLNATVPSQFGSQLTRAPSPHVCCVFHMACVGPLREISMK